MLDAKVVVIVVWAWKFYSVEAAFIAASLECETEWMASSILTISGLRWPEVTQMLSSVSLGRFK